MENKLKNYRIEIGEGEKTPFRRELGVYQDGTTPMARDKSGVLWAVSGTTQTGQVAVYRGETAADLREAWSASFRFSVGTSGAAFCGVRYPEGVLSRGHVWPFGLYICPNTGRFFLFFHNETGWHARDTGYDSFGLCSTPRYDTDFRHIGLLHSDDEGRTWEFDRWILAAEEPCFCADYKPTGAEHLVGQPHGVIRLGAGDFTLFDDPDGEYLYLVYNIASVNQDTGLWEGCNAYVARSRKRKDGVMGDFVKWYDGAFCEAGLFGKESPIMENIWHARIVRCEPLGCYVMSGCPIDNSIDPKQPILNVTVLHTGNTLTEWSERITVTKDGKPFGNHYVALVPDGREPPSVIGGSFYFLLNHNATDVIRHHAKLQK